MAAGIPVIGGSLILSGATAIILNSDDYLVEYQLPGLEGGQTQRFGRGNDKLTIHGILYESGADIKMAKVSGFFSFATTISVPSYITSNYFVNAPILLNKFEYFYEPGHAYPYYVLRLEGLLSGDGYSGYVFSGGAGPLGLPGPCWPGGFIPLTSPVNLVVVAQMYTDYVQPNVINSQAFGSYILISGVSGY